MQAVRERLSSAPSNYGPPEEGSRNVRRLTGYKKEQFAPDPPGVPGGPSFFYRGETNSQRESDNVRVGAFLAEAPEKAQYTSQHIN